MNISRKVKGLHIISRYSFNEEILKESSINILLYLETFKQKPIEIKMTS